MFGTILLAVDSSPQSERAGALATKLATATGDEVVVVHATEIMAARGGGFVELDGDRVACAEQCPAAGTPPGSAVTCKVPEAVAWPSFEQVDRLIHLPCGHVSADQPAVDVKCCLCHRRPLHPRVGRPGQLHPGEQHRARRQPGQTRDLLLRMRLRPWPDVVMRDDNPHLDVTLHDRLLAGALVLAGQRRGIHRTSLGAGTHL